MRFATTTSLWTLLVLLACGLAAHGVAAHPAGFVQRAHVPEGDADELSIFARQDDSTTTTTSSAAAAVATTCSMTTRLARGQSASWTSASVLSCCTAWNATSCYSRWQSTVSASEQCIIPSCSDLASMDESLMHGFSALQSSNGLGQLKNTFLITSSAYTGSWLWRQQATLVGAMVATVLTGALALL